MNLINTSSRKALMSYYTLQSNLLCLIAFVVIFTLELRKKSYQTEIYYLVKGAVTIAIIITAVVYHVALAPNNFAMDSLQNSIANKVWADAFVHTISPILVVIDYFLFDEKGKIKWWNPIIWILCSVIYLPFIFIRALILGNNTTLIKYPYFFLNVDKLGAGKVCLWCIGLVIFFTLLSYLLFLFDYKKRK